MALYGRSTGLLTQNSLLTRDGERREVVEATGAVTLAELFDGLPLDDDRDDQEESDDAGRISLW